MRTLKSFKLSTVAQAAMLACLGGAAWSGTLDENPLVSTSGDGLIFVDPAEGIEAPGLKAVTFTKTRLPQPSGPDLFVDPYEAIITDFSTLASRGDVSNCIMASIPDVYCDSEGGSGKRVKTQLTGPTPFDMLFNVTSSALYPTVDYFTFGKTSNFTGARITGFSLELLDSDGTPMSSLTPAQAVLFNQAATAIGIGARLPDGLFGDGGQEGTIGFFSTSRASLTSAVSSDVIDFTDLTNAEYVADFGTYFLDDSMVPDGLFWDDNNDPSDEAALIAWNNLAGGGWTYGNIALPADLNARLSELAGALGVSVADLGYVAGGLVPQAIVDLAEANGLFEAAKIEDLRNANLNFTITVGNVESGQFILRIAPRFEPIVERTVTPYQFRTAGYLDGAANVPYLDIGNAATYQAAIADIMALDAEAGNEMLETIGFSFLSSFSGIGLEFGRAVSNGIGRAVAESTSDGSVLATKGMPSAWEIGDNTYAVVSLGASKAEFDRTLNNIGYDVETKTGLAGIEKRLDSTRSVGVIAGYSDATADIDSTRGEVDGSGFFLAAFGRTAFGEGGAAQAMIGFQDLSFDTTRNVMGQTALGSTDGSQLFALVEGEYMFDRGGFRFGPTGSFEMYDMSIDAFDETGAGAWNLSVGDQDASFIVMSLGMRGEYKLADGDRAPLLSGAVSYNRSSGSDRLASTGFVGLPVGGTPVDGMDMDWVSLELGVSAHIGRPGGKETRVNAGYVGNFGSDYEGHAVQLSLSMQF